MEGKERHIHVAGATGKGNSKVLEQMIRSDIASGRSVCVIDPQGDLVQRLKSQPDFRKVMDEGKVVLINETTPD